MTDFEALDFAGFLQSRWRQVAICCVLAVVLAGAGSLLLRKQYTATASIMIELPGGLDPRSPTAVSPVYLESLRTFEHVVSSDTLFLGALEHLHIRGRYARQSLETVKRGMLEVVRPANTRIIRISATLENPKEAQALVQYIAQQAVALNQAIGDRSAMQVLRETQAVFENSEVRLRAAQKAMNDFTSTAAGAGLAADSESAGELKYQTDRDLGKAKADLAENLARLPEESSEWLRRQVAADRARIADLETQQRDLARSMESKGALLERRNQRRDALESELTSARTEFDASKSKLADVKTSAGFRGERLDVFDPGIVPQKPSSPNIPLIMMAALVISSMASLGWLTLRFGYERMVRARAQRSYSFR